MSYRIVSTIPALEPMPLRGFGSMPPRAPGQAPIRGSYFRSQGMRLSGLGTMLDANVLTSAWYLPLVERINKVTAARSYAWAPYKYLSNWDALDYNMSFSSFGETVDQEATLYQWDGSQWRKTTVGSSI
jgi:hypothetical protein